MNEGRNEQTNELTNEKVPVKINSLQKLIPFNTKNNKCNDGIQG